jgi:hypothetical protein
LKTNKKSTLKNALAYNNACVVAVNSKVVGLAPGTNASVVKIHNAMSSQARLENKNIFLFFGKTL